MTVMSFVAGKIIKIIKNGLGVFKRREDRYTFGICYTYP